MRRLALVISVLFYSILLHAQEECNDIVYKPDGELIFDCCIEKVVSENIVHYTKNGLHTITEAITKNGQYVDLKEFSKSLHQDVTHDKSSSNLYRGHNYDYYRLKYEKAKRGHGIGIFLTLSGLGLGIYGYVALSDTEKSNDQYGSIAYWTGAILINIGIPVSIAAQIKKANNRKAMDLTKRGTNLSLQTTNNGVGLVFNF